MTEDGFRRAVRDDRGVLGQGRMRRQPQPRRLAGGEHALSRAVGGQVAGEKHWVGSGCGEAEDFARGAGDAHPIVADQRGARQRRAHLPVGRKCQPLRTAPGRLAGQPCGIGDLQLQCLTHALGQRDRSRRDRQQLRRASTERRRQHAALAVREHPVARLSRAARGHVVIAVRARRHDRVATRQRIHPRTPRLPGTTSPQ